MSLSSFFSRRSPLLASQHTQRSPSTSTSQALFSNVQNPPAISHTDTTTTTNETTTTHPIETDTYTYTYTDTEDNRHPYQHDTTTTASDNEATETVETTDAETSTSSHRYSLSPSHVSRRLSRVRSQISLDADHELDTTPWNLITNPIPHRTHIIIEASAARTRTQLFLLRPLTGPLLFHNTDSTARDHCANERTFLSWLRLSVYLAIVSVAIVISFHLKTEPSATEKRLAFPLGIIFWVLSLASLLSGLSSYIKTVWLYSRRRALVQSGVKTQILFTVVASAIVAACILFLAIDAES